ncbi:DUF4870 family protein [Idiomarina ramblicola]|uniref:DUF4870 domain-containing protein n=1 Tax=Idiomarina ramblicola TaxID=263724 RepID=A0A432YTG0_9GAMM|nr:hypothetical protein [Idiomarina ramblicola]RUO64892.1 hypothetical protein CWI78_12025 [Idiomarina ramblicola]
MTTEVNSEHEEQLKKLALVGYILYALSLIIPFASIAAVILAYLKRSEARGTWLESHFNWLIKTFWIAVVGTIIGLILMFVIIGYLVLLAVTLWVIYRVVRGWLALSENKPVIADI